MGRTVSQLRIQYVRYTLVLVVPIVVVLHGNQVLVSYSVINDQSENTLYQVVCNL